MPEINDALVIGAGPAGLAAAAALRERGTRCGHPREGGGGRRVWRRHYDRLRLHTDRSHSALPGLPMPRAYGRYPSRLDVIDYLERYAAVSPCRPQFGTDVRYDPSRRNAMASGRGRQRLRMRPPSSSRPAWADFPYSPMLAGARAPSAAKFCIPAPTAIPSAFTDSGSWSSASAIRAARSRSISLRPTSRSRFRCAARSRSCPASSSASRSWPGRSPSKSCRPASPTRSTRRPSGWRSARSRSSDFEAGGEGPAPDGRRGRPHSASRRRHARHDARRPDCGAPGHRKPFRQKRSRSRTAASSLSTRSFSQPGFGPTSARCCQTSPAF